LLLATEICQEKCAAENEKFQNLDITEESSIWLGIASWAELQN